jgi:hypothetical protein
MRRKAMALSVPFVLSQTNRDPMNLWEGMNWQLGFKFSTGAIPPTITHLGRWKLDGNRQIHPVTLVKRDPSGIAWAPVITAGVDMAGAEPPGDYVYAALPVPAVLLANSVYAISSLEFFPDGDWFYCAEPVHRMPQSTQDSYTGGIATAGGAIEFSPDFSNVTTFNDPPHTYGPLNFKVARKRHRKP